MASPFRDSRIFPLPGDKTINLHPVNSASTESAHAVSQMSYEKMKTSRWARISMAGGILESRDLDGGGIRSWRLWGTGTSSITYYFWSNSLATCILGRMGSWLLRAINSRCMKGGRGICDAIIGSWPGVIWARNKFFPLLKWFIYSFMLTLENSQNGFRLKRDGSLLKLFSEAMLEDLSWWW